MLHVHAGHEAPGLALPTAAAKGVIAKVAFG